jgi:hypothetical protein
MDCFDYYYYYIWIFSNAVFLLKNALLWKWKCFTFYCLIRQLQIASFVNKIECQLPVCNKRKSNLSEQQLEIWFKDFLDCPVACNPILSNSNLSIPNLSMSNISISITPNDLKYRITYFIEFQLDQKPKLSNQ